MVTRPRTLDKLLEVKDKPIEDLVEYAKEFSKPLKEFSRYDPMYDTIMRNRCRGSGKARGVAH
ncbi:MAG: hypothetical protein V1837_08000 [Candidatus Woesearchaeota archaeon]